MMINLKAETGAEKAIFDYLTNNASEVLANKINTGTKTLKDCMNYITGEAKKQAVSGCAMISDSEVYGWAVHFFEEDSIKAPTKSVATKVEVKKEAPAKKAASAVKPEPKKAERSDDNLEGQMNIMDFLGV